MRKEETSLVDRGGSAIKEVPRARRAGEASNERNPNKTKTRRDGDGPETRPSFSLEHSLGLRRNPTPPCLPYYLWFLLFGFFFFRTSHAHTPKTRGQRGTENGRGMTKAQRWHDGMFSFPSFFCSVCDARGLGHLVVPTDYRRISLSASRASQPARPPACPGSFIIVTSTSRTKEKIG